MTLYKKVFENNSKWAALKLEKDSEFFRKMAQEQDPEILYIGCADSRVPASEIMGLAPGDVFVHRNVANLVIPFDNNVNAVIQYAVEFLNVKHVVVCGHYGCGGVKAALKRNDMGQLNSWLQPLRDVYRLHQQELDGIPEKDRRVDRLVELNVVEQCINIIKTDHFQKSWDSRGGPEVHGWVYDLKTGLLKDMNLDIPEIMKDIRKIYELKLNE